METGSQNAVEERTNKEGMSMTTFDFTIARNKHVFWKIRLRGFLDGQESLTEEQALSHKDCDLGKWLYNDGMKRYGTIPEMKALEKEHISLHARVRRIMELKHAGSMAAAREELKQLDRISDHVVALLTAVEQKVSGAGAADDHATVVGADVTAGRTAPFVSR